MNKKMNIIIWFVAVCAVIAAAYTIYTKNKPQNIASPPRNEATTQDSQSGKTLVPDFSLKDLNGNTVKLSNYRGEVVILNFWAVWCKYCKQEMPDLNKLNNELQKKNKAVILAVDVQEPHDTVKNYLSSNNIDLKVLLDQDGSLSQTFGVSGFPTTFVINKDGTLYTYISGTTNKETLLEILNKIEKGEPAQ